MTWDPESETDHENDGHLTCYVVYRNVLYREKEIHDGQSRYAYKEKAGIIVGEDVRNKIKGYTANELLLQCSLSSLLHASTITQLWRFS